ncbi:hypothetical protein LBMAG49_23740 [Planctomycetota bacterium]|jgi:hypothetical protein|nr:hypothetical protein LBMAG49_23740 [Planctomycetota bacterium]
MSYDPRTIAFSAELFYPPMQLRADLVQGVHNALFRQPAFSYHNFQVAHDGIHLANVPQAPGQVSQATFLPDRLVLREELRGTSVEDFATRVVNVATTAFQSLGIVASLAQQFCIRSLINPKHHRDGREFLAQGMFASSPDAWQLLGRPPASVGVRMTFGPTETQRELHQVRIETWPQDPRSLWLENTSSFATPLPVALLPQVAAHLYTSYGFLNGPVSAFLANHDRA